MKKSLAIVGAFFLVACSPVCLLHAHSWQTVTGIQIEDAKLGKGVEDREITGENTEFDLNERVYLWLKVDGASGETLKVTWKNGDHSYESELQIGGSPWRTWCYKTGAIPGDWTVTVADPGGHILKEMSFKVK